MSLWTSVKPMVRALSHRNFRLFVVGQGISLIGTWMQQIAMAWLVYRMTNSAVLLGVVGFAGQIPAFFLAPVAGVVSDRANRRALLLVTQLLAMIQAFLLAVLTLTGLISVWQLIALSVVLGTVNTFDMTIRQAFMMEMVPDQNDLANAIALNSTLVNLTRLIGPSIAGITIAVTGEGICFLLNGLSYLAVLWALVAMKIPAVAAPARPHWVEGIVAGIKYTFGFAPLRAVILLLALIGFMAAPYSVLLPVFASEILHGGASTLGFLTAAAGLGALAGTIYLASREGIRGAGTLIALCAAALGVALVIFSLSTNLPTTLAALFVIGFAQMVLMAASNTVLQTLVDAEMRGRVMSFYTLALLGVAPLGGLLAGVLADQIGAARAVLAGAPFCLLGAALFARKLPQLRQKARAAMELRRQRLLKTAAEPLALVHSQE
ncbi:MAG TPA: MFS transporter [Gemmataceae bacterium]|jgi:MFS family permease|nr:MFS transporter [Gemmataceae bacterium]